MKRGGGDDGETSLVILDDGSYNGSERLSRCGNKGYHIKVMLSVTSGNLFIYSTKT